MDAPLTLDRNGNPDLLRQGGYASIADWARDSDYREGSLDGLPTWFHVDRPAAVDIVVEYQNAQVAYAENWPEEVSAAAKRELRADPSPELIELFPCEWDEIADEVPACVRCGAETASFAELVENKPVALTDDGWVCPACSGELFA